MYDFRAGNISLRREQGDSVEARSITLSQ